MYEIKLTHGAVMPVQANDFDSGFDLRARGYSTVKNGKIQDPVWFDDDCSTFVLKPMERVLIKTGIQIKQPKPSIVVDGGYNIPDIQVRPRSGMAIKYGIGLVNSPGTVDNGYLDDIGVILINLSNDDFNINCDDRIGQMLFSTSFIPNNDKLRVVDEFSSGSDRGYSGFGDSGK